ncbi:MAG: hypothetical protein JWP11_3707 [Frankiales bacterium]|nr:hypothetical protein [Frankiales bacterium]
MSAVDEAKALLETSGYVVLKEKSYRQAQERQRIARVMQESAEQRYEHQQAWLARAVFPWERHLVQRVDHLARLATRLGAKDEDWAGPPCTCGGRQCPDPTTASARYAGVDDAIAATPREQTHGCPPDGSGLTPCCGRTPFELPQTDRMTDDAALVTCRGRSEAHVRERVGLGVYVCATCPPVHYKDFEGYPTASQPVWPCEPVRSADASTTAAS